MCIVVSVSLQYLHRTERPRYGFIEILRSAEYSLLSYFVSIVWQAVRGDKIWGVFRHPQVAVSVDWSTGSRWIVS